MTRHPGYISYIAHIMKRAELLRQYDTPVVRTQSTASDAATKQLGP